MKRWLAFQQFMKLQKFHDNGTSCTYSMERKELPGDPEGEGEEKWEGACEPAAGGRTAMQVKRLISLWTAGQLFSFHTVF